MQMLKEITRKGVPDFGTPFQVKQLYYSFLHVTPSFFPPSPGIAEAGMHSYAFKRIGASATDGDPGEPSPGIAEAGMHSYAQA